jgi:predicted CXXCH cytochrome family protein
VEDAGRREAQPWARLFVAALAAAPLAAAAAPASYAPGSGVNGSPHDLRRFAPEGGSDPATTRLCIYCHAPHDAYRSAGAARGTGPRAADAYRYLPLWNHRLATAAPVYTMYENGSAAPRAGRTASQTTASGIGPGDVSLLCLSCHDGSIAINRYGNREGTTSMPSASLIGAGGYLGNHHPIGFDYDAARAADPTLRDADATPMTTVSVIRDHLLAEAGDAAALRSRLECTSCHSAHNTGNTGEKLLWRSDAASALCLTCHDKGRYAPAR